MARFCLIGPTYPFRGGIAHHTTLLARALRQEHETLFISFIRQYPAWLFPGRSDRDPSQQPVIAEAERLLDPLNPLSWRRTYRRIREWQPEVLVIPWWVPFWAPAWAVLGRAVKRAAMPPKLLFICHNVVPHERGLFDRLALRLALAPADGFVVHSQQDRARLLGHFPAATVTVTPLPTYAALGPEGTSAGLPDGIPADRPLLLFCGFVRPYKGLDVLLDALPAVLERRPAHLLVAGEFWRGAEEYRRQIERLGLDEAVTILDTYVPNEDLSGLIRQAQVVVLPYRDATQSAVVQLAFGLGRPVITTNVGGLAEAVIDGQTGLIVPPEDPPALAAAIVRFFAEELGPVFEANIAGQRERFSWRRLVEGLEGLAQE
jgi:glycosyltransferase involved in cell wall biosynthesis